MKPLLPIAVALALAFGNAAMAAQPVDEPPPAGVPQSANERAGLPDLAKINRPAAEVSSKVDINNVPRTPSFHEVSPNGTEITEFRDKGKPVEINVQSNFGTRYQMSASPDTSPTVHDSGKPSTRLPSVNLRY
ncbi:hypothetical protein QF000_002224 [Paraburkholderia atlantica]|uniref:DUF2782 domain-containing protein n=2 Tax=Paraburkholderia TaxID=1822464 RepID=D5WES4_PARAM|nr:conserved hypothetical protein [Paraburkholderia atlantica]MBB5420536.1 hypothetical protein [Paraburkholderia atlantica]MBB5422704.1 hypothetical protein [Paraburkholderia atlantica]MBB5505499.1 hypothetical protein [Paraburkholderia atlantica]MPW07468.1 hypothetical protein [Paraburkholderia atlantica]